MELYTYGKLIGYTFQNYKFFWNKNLADFKKSSFN